MKVTNTTGQMADPQHQGQGPQSTFLFLLNLHNKSLQDFQKNI